MNDQAQDANEDLKSGTSRTPPYIAYATFKTVLANFKTLGIPPEVNKSAFPKFSGGVQSQVLLALRSLDLISLKNRPTPRLEAIVAAFETEKYKVTLAELLRETYPYVLALDLKTITPSAFADSFKDNTSAKDDVLRKCRTFFLNAAKDAGLELGPRIGNATFPRGPKPANGKRGKKLAAARPAEDPPPPPPPPPSNQSPVVDRLLEKFPEFDPKWPDEIKKKWFDGFERFMSGAGVNKKQE
ncbi:MAG: DUF5343 domain-containing protein [Nitrospiraceae bacterium]|nr:DUF5343 domain-containing protein [Nitrospiraceae bacterium]